MAFLLEGEIPASMAFIRVSLPNNFIGDISLKEVEFNRCKKCSWTPGILSTALGNKQKRLGDVVRLHWSWVEKWAWCQWWREGCTRLRYGLRNVLGLPDGPGWEGSSWMRNQDMTGGPRGALEWIRNKDLFLQQMLIELLVFVGHYSMYWRYITQDRAFLFLRGV